MRKVFLKLIPFVISLFLTPALHAQLTVGGIAFTGYNKDDNTVNGAESNDDFSFVLLQNIPAGTTIFFTDFGWTDANAFQNPDACAAGTGALADGIISWTTSVALNRGTHIRIRPHFPINGGTNTAIATTVGTATGVKITKNSELTGTNEYLNLAAGGDQIFAYTGTFAAPTLIAGIDMTAGWDGSLPACQTTSSASRQPAALSSNNYSFTFTGEFDNGRLSESVRLTKPTDLNVDRANIANQANWQFDESTAFLLPGNLFILPVNFTYIKAAEKGGQVQVEFGVGTETDITEYMVERSADGRQYASIGSVAAARRSSYSFADIRPIAGVNFYRIRAVEINGGAKYSTIANINLSKAGKGIGVYPSIVRNNQFTLQISNLPAGSYRMNIHNAVGQLVISRNINHAGISSTQTVNLPASVQKGVYRVKLAGAAETAVTTIIVE